MECGICFCFCETDEKKARLEVSVKLNLGMEEAGLRLAKCYLYGTGVPQDIEMAKEILLQLGRHGFPTTQG